jgi:ribosomal protein S18 acetylase RimI-like enzyme
MNIEILPLQWFQLRNVNAFLNLKKEIEREAEHLVVGAGERQEKTFHVLAKMFLNRKRTLTLVAMEGNQIVGYLTAVYPKFKKLRGNAYIALAVKSSHRGKGIGTKLMRESEKHAKTKNIRRMELEVFGKNVKAIDLYKRLGYEIEGRRRNAVENTNGFDDIVFMAKTLV